MLVIMHVLGMLGCRGLGRPDREISCNQSQVYLWSYLRGQEEKQRTHVRTGTGTVHKQHRSYLSLMSPAWIHMRA